MPPFDFAIDLSQQASPAPRGDGEVVLHTGTDASPDSAGLAREMAALAFGGAVPASIGRACSMTAPASAREAVCTRARG